MPSTNRLGSNPGRETKARTSPVAGSIATSAPRRSPNAASATSCSLMSSDRRRLLPDDGRRARQRAHGATAGVDLDLLPARGAVQLALVRQLDADLAHVVGALVVGGLVPFRDALDVVVVDAADVADDVRGDLAVRVLAEQPRLDFHAGEAVAVDGEARHLLVREPRAQRQASRSSSIPRAACGTACGRAAARRRFPPARRSSRRGWRSSRGVNSSVYAE